MLPTMWSYEALAQFAADALTGHARLLAAEQAVRGLDSLPELGFHPLLARAFADAGFGVHPEQPYPTPPRRLPRHSERERCDLALTQCPGLIADAVDLQREHAALEGTLFAHAAHATLPGIAPSDVLWIEVKVIAQHGLSAGVLAPNAAYASELLRGPATDAAKLARDPRILHAAVLVVLFTASAEIADHDLGVLTHRLLDRDLPIASPIRVTMPIPDLLGNSACTIALVPVRGTGASD